MKYHDCKTDKPWRSGNYITYKVYGNDVIALTLAYDKERDGWNINGYEDRRTEIFPMYWSELPTAEEITWMVKGAEGEHKRDV